MYRYAAVQSDDQFMNMGSLPQTNDSKETVARHLCNFYAQNTSVAVPHKVSALCAYDFIPNFNPSTFPCRRNLNLSNSFPCQSPCTHYSFSHKHNSHCRRLISRAIVQSKNSRASIQNWSPQRLCRTPHCFSAAASCSLHAMDRLSTPL